MKRLSFSAKLYLGLAPLALMCVGVAFLARTALQENSAELVQGRQVKELAMTSLARLLEQDDATKAMIIDLSAMVGEPGERKIAAYDANLIVLKEMDAKVPPNSPLRGLIRQLNELDSQKLRPIDTEVLEAMAGENAEQAKKLYFERYVPERNKYEAILRQIGTEAEKNALAASEEMQRANRRSFLRICAALLVGVLGVTIVTVCMGRKLTGQLKLISNTLSQSADGLAQSAADSSGSCQSLAAGASRQASALEEASASLEEMGGMAKRNVENATRTNELARETRSAADAGVASMQQMSQAMAAMKGSSDEIAKIIKTIDEIAFQTNILALNAAVEAARAGEAGMGFAVVADEVRALAQRSAGAAKETAAKIESSLACTSQGVELSAKVARALDQIAAKVRQVDELAAAVAGASREQTQGITQINKAVSEMDKVTQGNAANAEENAAAAEQLRSQALMLSEVVHDLRRLVGGAEGSSASSSTAANNEHLPDEPATRLLPARNARVATTPARNGRSRGAEFADAFRS